MSLHHFEVELPIHYIFLKQMIEQGLQIRCCLLEPVLNMVCNLDALAEDLPTNPITPYGFAKDTLRKQLQIFSDPAPFQSNLGKVFLYVWGWSQAKSLFNTTT